MSETTTSAERIHAAINLEVADRVPVAPLNMYFCARFGGISTKEFLEDMAKQTEVSERVFEQMGGYDAWYSVPGILSYNALRARWPLEVFVPGHGLPDDAPLPQLNERVVMLPEDYDLIIEAGYDKWFAFHQRRLYPDLDLDVIAAETRQGRENLTRFYQKWEVERNVPLLHGVIMYHPIEIFSFARSFYEFSLDMVRRPDKVLGAAQAATEPILERAIQACKKTGVKTVWVGGWRTNATFISPRQFEKFCLPIYKTILNELVGEGLTPLLHFDANWNPLLRYIREFPPKKCIFAPDQETDLVEAKRIIGDHTCLMGNVSPQVLSIGTVDETVAECKKLIDAVGRDGGFILSSGCEVPINAKPENVAAMIDAARTYGRYR